MADETQLMVWIDQDLCTGDGICSEICPDVFEPRDDGLWVVKEEEKNFGRRVVFDGEGDSDSGPDGARGLARIPDDQIDLAIEAAEECPGECIMIQPFQSDLVHS